MTTPVYTIKVEEARPATGEKPSAGPVYRCIYAKDGLFEMPAGINSPWELFSQSVKKHSHNQMLGHRETVDGKAGPYVWHTYQEVYDEALRIGSAIRSRGINPGGRCGIYGSNCPEWIMTMEGCISQGIQYVPLYDTLGPNAVDFIINHAEVSLIFVQENKIQAIQKSLPNCISHLKTIVSFGEVTDEQKKEIEQFGVSCFSWKEFSSSGTTDYDLPPIAKGDIFTIMYTSGTTGDPKGVLLSNEAIISEVLCMDYIITETDNEMVVEDIYFSFLPLAHIFDQDARYLLEDLQELKPTLFCGVPRVFERIYAGILDKIESGGALKKRIFQYAYDYKLKYLKMGLKQEEAAPFFDKIIKVALGGRVRGIISGAAPIPNHVEEFLRVTSCAVLSQGYGLTESTAGCFTSLANVLPMMGTVGIPMPTIEARLESVPDMGYDALSEMPRGELCLRGNTLFSGYYKRQDLTDEVLVDGWFHTGDVGEWLPNGAMKIIDRKKNIFKLSQGEYISVENTESVFGQCPLIAAIWVYGNSFESFLVAVVIPDKKALEDWATTHNETGDFHSLCQNPRAKKYILDELNSTGRKHKLRGFEMLRAIHLETEPFDIERDLVTPTFKLKRPQLLKYYKALNPELNNYNQDMDIVYARVFIAYLMGNIFFPNANTSLLTGYLTALTDHHIIGASKFDWGTPIMTALYRGLDEVSILNNGKGKRSVTGFYALLELWFFEYCRVGMYLVKVSTPTMFIPVWVCREMKEPIGV
ncbi:hypothetical protein GIB67_007410 [Kingdonia uniflora]|uniref:Long-chain-fatty-acid--CoA ligase n=1 Tax=Kingdonia uniflora TaxID=39325 RepID=A0A7J7MLJ3_9MAGN|nr:hypothetical protein GIB67_007410 [Kingdonia uniflora]